MTKDEAEEFIYDKLVELRVERHLSTEPNFVSFYEEAEDWFKINIGQDYSYISFELDTATGYLGIYSSNFYGHEIFMYVNDIDGNAIKQMREDKLNNLLK